MICVELSYHGSRISQLHYAAARCDCPTNPLPNRKTNHFVVAAGHEAEAVLHVGIYADRLAVVLRVVVARGDGSVVLQLKVGVQSHINQGVGKQLKALVFSVVAYKRVKELFNCLKRGKSQNLPQSTSLTFCEMNDLMSSQSALMNMGGHSLFSASSK